MCVYELLLLQGGCAVLPQPHPEEAVVEVFCSLISVDNKWVIQLFHNVLYLFHVLCYIFYEMQRYDFLCNYHHSFPNNF